MTASIYPKSQTVPWDHQRKSWDLSYDKKGFYFAHDMGVGKTKLAIDDMNGHDVRSALIICPKAVIPVWPREFEKHSHLTYKIITISDYTKSWSTTKKAQHIEDDLRTASALKKRVAVVINYEALLNPYLGVTYNDKNRIVKHGLLFKINWGMIILDEAHRAKSANSQTSLMCSRLAEKAEWRRCLSGTPMPHSPLDIYAQFRFLDRYIYGTTATAFKARYAILGGFDMKQIVEWQNIDELNQKFAANSHRVKKNDVLDLPPVMHQDIQCDISPKAMKMYKSLEADFIAFMDTEKISVTNALVKLLRLSQLASGYIQFDDGTKKVICNNKINLLKDIVMDLDLDEPLVIFCRFTQEIQRIKKILKALSRKPAELSGKIKEWEDFQYQDGEKKFDSIVVQIQAGSTGIDLTRACYCIFFSTGFSLGDYAQAEARLDRPGQTRPVTYYHIIANDTVDETVHQAIQFKKTVVEYVMDNVKALKAAKKVLTSRGILKDKKL